MNIRVMMLGLCVLLASCADDGIGEAPEGFEHLGGQEHSHFVFVHSEFLDDKTAQRAAGKYFCEANGHTNYCEVYMWKNKSHVATKLPINRKNSGKMGLYTLKDGQVKLRVLR